MGVMMTYSYELPNSPETYTVRVFSPAFFNAGTTSFFWRSTHSVSISGRTCVMVTRDIDDCARHGLERAAASKTTPA